MKKLLFGLVLLVACLSMSSIVFASDTCDSIPIFTYDSSQTFSSTTVKGIDVDSSGKLFITKYYDHKITVYDINKNEIFSIGGYGEDNDEFKYPKDITVDSDGYIYVADSSNNRIQIYTKFGGYVKKIQKDWWEILDPDLTLPSGVAVDSNKKVYTTSQNCVLIYNSDTSYFNKIGDCGSAGTDNYHFDHPQGIRIGSDEKIYVADTSNNRIQVYDSNRNYLMTIGGASGDSDYNFKNPQDIALDSQKRIYVADWLNRKIKVYNNAGGHVVTYDAMWDDYPISLAIDKINNKIYIGKYYPSYSLPIYKLTESCCEGEQRCNGNGMEKCENHQWGNSKCVIGQCAATCSYSSDCANKCVSNTWYYGGACLSNSCSCSYYTFNCDSNDGWYDTGNVRWVDDAQCKEKRQKEQNYRDYSCSIDGCSYSQTNTQWIDTGEKRNKQNGISCDDGNWCSVNDQCLSGSCSGSVRDCSSAGNQCNIGSCNEQTDNCVATPKQDETGCNDGLFCTVNDQCLSGSCSGSAKDCSDVYSCTDDSCNENADRCDNVKNDNKCSYGEVCNPIYFPLRPSGCGIVPDCAGEPIGTLCDDENYCNGPDECQLNPTNQEMECKNIGPSIDCSSFSDQCNVGKCDNDSKKCVKNPAPKEGFACNDGLFCNEGETCQTGLCKGGIVKTCNDGVDCTIDSCNEVNDQCMNSPDNSYCNNGLFCDGVEYCNVALGCKAGSPINCSVYNLLEIKKCANDPDKNPFTWDYAAGFASTCDENTDSCKQGLYSFTHTCDKTKCGAECESNSDCANTDCDYQDGCHGGPKYYNCQDVDNKCLDCSCEKNSCTHYTNCGMTGTDADGDGWDVECGDCNDFDYTIHPGVKELKDGKDNDCNGLTDDLPVTITIDSPVNKVYDERRVLVDISLDKKVKYLYRALNSDRFSRLCTDCDAYSHIMLMREGENDLTIKAVEYDGNVSYNNTKLFVDTISPAITRVEPKSKSYVKGNAELSVNYREKNLDGVTLFYGRDSVFNELPLNNCAAGTGKKCAANVNLASYNGQQVSYYFVVRDAVHNKSSKLMVVNVDNTVPAFTAINSPLNRTYSSSSIRIDLKLSEKVDSLKMSTNDGRFLTLCSSCDAYNRTRSFSSKKTYNVTFQATDKAGNVGYNSVVFTRN